MVVSARLAALRLLKIRVRSCGEITQKLLQKGFTKEEVASTVDLLLNQGLLDDRAFTKSWIAYRLARPFGFKRIVLELKQKGIAQEIIDQEMLPFKQQENDQTIIDLAKRRVARLSSIDPVKRKKRVMDFLLRRGFSVEQVMKAIKHV